MGMIKGPVTAVAIWDDVLCAGVGSFIKLYNLRSRQISFVKRAFKKSVVHGIKTFHQGDDHLIVIFGGKELQIYQIYKVKWPSSGYLECIFTWTASDWIWDAILLYSDYDRDKSSLIATALGHNSVSLVDWKNNTKLKETHCEEKCILYSAHFVCEPRPTWKSLSLCSGTVFNQVVIWKPSVLKSDASAARVIQRIYAHDGVIFNMNFDSHTGRLVTASDDRSIRVWDCGWLVDSEKFTDTPVITKSEPLCKLYGHESRVWKAQYVRSDSEEIIISIGEDGYCIAWKIAEPNIQNNDLNCVIMKRIKCHKGRNIWSMVVEEGYLATGGGDCGIRLYKVSDLNDKVVITKHPHHDSIANAGTIKSVHVCNENVVLAHTDHGVLLRYDISSSEWIVLLHADNVKSYSVVSVCAEKFAVAIGNTKGTVKIMIFDDCWKSLRQEESINFCSSGRKIHNISWEYDVSACMLYVSGVDGKFAAFQVVQSKCLLLVSEVHAFKLPLAKHRWHMGAISVKRSDVTYMLVGDRRGSLHLYKSGCEEPLNTIHGVHGKNGVTSISRIGDSMYSTGRDGIWRKLELCVENETIKILKQNRAAQGMDWLASVVPLNLCHDKIAVLGFYGRNFIAWSSETGDTLFSVDCGGAHRDWSFTTGNDKTLLAFVKESTLHMTTAKENILLENSVLDAYFHAGQITCVKRLTTWKDTRTSKSVTLLVTCGEDTKVYISLYLHQQDMKTHYCDSIKKLCLIDDHISNVRAVTTSTGEDNEVNFKVFLFTGGGRASLKCYLLNVDKTRISCDAEFICAYRRNHETRPRSNVDAEMRFMDLTAWTEERKIILAASCSDGVVRIFSFDKGARAISYVCHSHILSHCLLKVETLLIDSQRWIITAGTDGFLRIWLVKVAEDTPSIIQDLVLQHHMSGINALDVMKLPRRDKALPLKSWLIASGGDDNSIHLSTLCYHNSSFNVHHQHHNDKAHSTQITGLKFLPKKSEEAILQLISTSIDQRVTKWTVFDNDETLMMTYANSLLTSIADISALEVWGNKDAPCCVVCGQGIEVIDQCFSST